MARRTPKSYDELKAGEGIRSVAKIKHALQTEVTCTLLEIG
jgi:hypothetical protein